MTQMGNKLRNLRNERNLSQAQLAKRIGVTSSTVALYETGDLCQVDCFISVSWCNHRLFARSQQTKGLLFGCNRTDPKAN